MFFDQVAQLKSHEHHSTKHQAEDTGEKKLILTCNFPLCFLPRDPQTEAQLLGVGNWKIIFGRGHGMVKGTIRRLREKC